jgi:hypothetical protein
MKVGVTLRCLLAQKLRLVSTSDKGPKLGPSLWARLSGPRGFLNLLQQLFNATLLFEFLISMKNVKNTDILA